MSHNDWGREDWIEAYAVALVASGQSVEGAVQQATEAYERKEKAILAVRKAMADKMARH
jgi:hypothetical protein